jgi:hypothetical protein
MLSGLHDLGCRMNVGKTLFAQVMGYVPWKTFGRIIERHTGDVGVRTLRCADLFRVMQFIPRARELYAKEPLDIDMDATVYALDATTIDLCLSLFEWAPFRSTKAAVKMHTLLDLRGSIPAFIHISDGKMGDVKVLDFLPIEAGAF